MYVNKSFFVAVTLLLTFISSVSGHEKKWPEKRLRQVWPSAQSFISKQISLTPSQISELKTEGIKIGSEDRIPTFYFAQVKEPPSDKAKSVGIIIFIDEYGDNGLMEISVAMGSDGKTKKIDVWEHSENVLIAKDDFLNQFIGKSSKDSFIATKDYRPVPNAINASEAMARAVLKALKITDIIFRK
jgi:hypothetical protein